jgi:hypothetical protein
MNASKRRTEEIQLNRDLRVSFVAGVPGLEPRTTEGSGLGVAVTENRRDSACFRGSHGVQSTDEYRLVTANLVTSEGNLVTKVVT